jgi:hypothetical protein
MGTQLLLDALKRVDRAAAISGGRLVVADPIDESAREFYLHHGFTRVTASHRVFARIAALRAILVP